MSEARVLDPRTTAAGSETSRARGLRMGGRLVEVADHNCFACGNLNTHGLRLVLHSQDGRCWTDLALPMRFEGWEGIAHGGIVTTILDEVMAWALIDHDAWGLTARMTVAFKRPIRIGYEIRGEGWVIETRRRLLRTAGRILDRATGDVLATAAGTYVAAPEARKRELKGRYRFRIVDESPDSVDSRWRRDQSGS
jgi:acyl-coenzyme A thioesterase PaaI-like protein